VQNGHNRRRVGAVLDVTRGAAIGVVETIPGVSGATMALVVGVYERLLTAAGSLVDAVRGLADPLRGRGGGRTRRAWRDVDWGLLVAILAGMVAALLTASRVLPPLLERHPVGTNALFFGMIVASVLVPALALGRPRGVGEWAAIPLAAGAAWWLTGLPGPTDTASPSLWLVALVAAAAVSALVLPGLSGSFLLLVLGLYEPTLQAVAEADLPYVAAFAGGALVGLASFVSLLRWLMREHRRALMAVVIGVLLGSLRALWPWQDTDRGLLAPDAAGAAMIPVALAGAAVVATLALIQHTQDRRALGAAPDEADTEPLSLYR
jgi:putative membrane protein